MEENQSIFNTKNFAEEKAGLKRLASKYGIAMILLVLNNKLAPYLFVQIYAFITNAGGIGYNALLALNAVSAYLFPVILLFLLFKDEIKAFIPDKSYKPFRGEALFLFTAGMTAGMAGSFLTQLINSIMDSIFGTGEIEDAFSGLKPQNMTEFGVFVFFICIIAPIAEEIIFRNILLKPLRAYGDLTAVLVSGIVFGLYHGNFDQFAYATLLGIFFSAIAVKYNSIIPVTILHALNNLIVTCGSDLNSACEKTSEQFRFICGNISSACVSLSSVLAFTGGISIIVCIFRKSYRFNSQNRYLSASEALEGFISTPLVLIGIIVMFSLFFD